MVIPLTIPTSVRTQKDWVIKITKIPFFGGYLIALGILLPPTVAGVTLGKIVFSVFSLIQGYWVAVLFVFGFSLFFWDRWLRFNYNTEIRLVYVPVEYLSYIAIASSIVLVYV